MKNVNFRTLENLQAPDALVEKLLAIPETTEEKTPVVIPWWRNRAVIAAASVVLVSLISLTVYFSIGNKIDTPIAVKPLSSDAPWETDVNGETIVPDEFIAPDGSVYYDEDGNIIPPDAVVNGTVNPSATTVAPTEKGTPAPTAKSGAAESDKPQPTENGKPRPTTAPSVTEGTAPVVSPTEPGVLPSEPVVPSEPSVEEPATEAPEFPYEPTFPTEAPVYYTTITGGDRQPTYGADGKPLPVYCKVLSADRSVLYGDSNLYSEQHRALTWFNQYGVLKCSYTPADYGILPADGRYYYEFYDANGRRIGHGLMYLSK